MLCSGVGGASCPRHTTTPQSVPALWCQTERRRVSDRFMHEEHPASSDKGVISRRLDRIFNNDEGVIEAGRVGNGYDKQLKEILNAEILPIVEEFDEKLNNGS
ncbi:hypothetical protein GBF38_014370 [Nibea albiflora]|uniref:Uncharacterized protein n=1 Tax=Nibea albiflora TaxID=240163 RepID=A0ACB7F6M1_NIBAL|nr:hypothetical protein GBF38_014370 [Nibea albiflora]